MQLLAEPPGIKLSEVETQQIDWLWQRRIPLGKITILDGDPGMGKSLLAINIAACLSTGRPMPDGTPGRQGSTILIAPEDSAEDTIKPRMEAAGGDPSKVFLLNTIEDIDEKRLVVYPRTFSLSRDLDELEREIKRTNAILGPDPLPAKAQEVLVSSPTLLAYHVGSVALVGSSQDFRADALRRG